jgi:hypothetical protein
VFFAFAIAHRCEGSWVLNHNMCHYVGLSVFYVFRINMSIITEPCAAIDKIAEKRQVPSRGR